MATRSNIAIKNTDGTIRSIYCHWDGYPAHNGEMLRRYYNTTDKINQLIDLGSVSSLRPELGEKHPFDRNYEEPELEGMYDNWTLAYHRDRGEDLRIDTFQDAVEYVDAGEEYMYLWDGQNWLVNDHGEKDKHGFPVFDFVENKISQKDLESIGWEPEGVA
jgi:hypothetical protein